VGRLLLPLFGYRDPELVRFADEISTALQLTNFWQDVAADAARDRVYVPAEDLHFFCVSEAELKALKPTRPLRELLRFEVARTRALYEKGRPLLGKLGNDLKLELALMWLIGEAILDKIEDADYDVFSARPTIGRRDQARVLAKAAKHWATSLDLQALRNLWPG
jgi:hydroxysqualene synthase